MWSVHDLIVAPATPPGPGPRAIVRLAGDGLEPVVTQLFTVALPGLPRPGEPPRAVSARLAADGLGLDWGELAVGILYWPGPGGPVGGPLAEVQLPGSTPLVEAVVAAACDAGARLARGGEFTLRGFLAGRLDLVQAEAVLAVVDARTPGELSAALDRMAGGAGGGLREARATLLDLLADIEAEIDFADEATPDAVPRADAAGWLAMERRLVEATAGVRAALQRLRLRDAGATELPRVVLAGRPNIGKSSLFNALVGRDAALVADESGTTRDWIEAPLPNVDDAAASPACVLVDLAGLPPSAGVETTQDDPGDESMPVESAAVAAARGEIARADVVVICRDAADADDREVFDHACSVAFDVRTRCDRVPQPVGPWGTATIATSTVTGRGVEELALAIRGAVAGLPPRASPATLRLAAGLAAAADPLTAAVEAVHVAATGGPIDEALVAGHVRRAVEALGEVTGVEIGNDLLDRIFSRHCIGK